MAEAITPDPPLDLVEMETAGEKYGEVARQLHLHPPTRDATDSGLRGQGVSFTSRLTSRTNPVALVNRLRASVSAMRPAIP